MSRNRLKIMAALGASVFAASVYAGPVGAQSTEEKLEDAKARFLKISKAADDATREFESARERFIQTQDQIDETKARIGRVEGRIGRVEARLGQRAREVYQMGTNGMLEVLFISESITDFSDRVVFLDRVAQEDADLVVQADVLSEELARFRSDLKVLAEKQAATTETLAQKRDLVYEKLDDAAALREELAEQLAEEEAAALAAAQAAQRQAPGSIGTVTGAALQACPVPGSSFVDTWGAPRSGGRSHQGVDMMAGYGTPVYAAIAGIYTQSSSALGGLQAYISGGGNTTFYAHMQAYEGGSRTVSAGELIGYVGDSGNATGTPHVHFEYHPGGGGPVNPYPYVAAVC